MFGSHRLQIQFFSEEEKLLTKHLKTGLGLLCLRDFESEKLLEHQNSSKHIAGKVLEEFRNSVNNALAVSASKY